MATDQTATHQEASPKPTSKGQYIFKRERPSGSMKLDPYDVKGVYRSHDQIQRAIKNGTFQHAKVMHMDFNTKNIYWLCNEK